MSQRGVTKTGAPDVSWTAVAFCTLIAISILARLTVAHNFRARASWDTSEYIVTADAIRHFDFSNYDGRRTPVYPLLLILAGMDWTTVRWIQSVLGLVIAAMMFAIAWDRTRSAMASFLVGVLSSLALSELAFEQVIYSETLCTFFVVLSVLAFARATTALGDRSFDHALLGMAAALAGMTRPMLLFLGALYFCCTLARTRMRNALILVLAPTLVLALGWSMVNEHTLNYFGVTTTTGYNLSNHSGAFMELAPPQYAKIADIYLRYRAWQIPRIGSQTMTIWYAEGEIKRATGLSTAELSKQLTRMSLEMFAEHPLLYLASVTRAWIRFWGVGFYHFIGFFRDSAGSSIVYGVILALGTLQLGINAVFLVAAVVLLIGWLRGKASFDLDRVVVAIVLAGSVVQALFEYGENVRYLVPLVPLTIYTVVIFLWEKLRFARESS